MYPLLLLLLLWLLPLLLLLLLLLLAAQEVITTTPEPQRKTAAHLQRLAPTIVQHTSRSAGSVRPHHPSLLTCRQLQQQQQHSRSLAPVCRQ
jgi:hypothetical protein